MTPEAIQLSASQSEDSIAAGSEPRCPQLEVEEAFLTHPIQS